MILLNYDQTTKFHYWLAEKLGIASQVTPVINPNKKGLIRKDITCIIPKYTYVSERELDDDRWIEFEKVGGTQIYPVNKNFLQEVEIDFGWDSCYRDIIREKIRNRKK